MTNEQKKQIVAAAAAWLDQYKDISQNKLAQMSGINSGYLSNMLAGKFHTTVNSKRVEIADKWFLMLAEQVGYAVEKIYWERANTLQFMQIYTALQTAKNNGGTAMLIGDTGCGKSSTIDVFCQKNPVGTIRITVSSLYRLQDIMNELGEKIDTGMPSNNGSRMQKYSQKIRLDKMVEKLKDMKRKGLKPMIIFDEGENLEVQVLKMIKGLYDALKDHCAIVIIGTPQLMDKLLNLRQKNRDAIPQLYRRFKAGLTNIAKVDKKRDYALILDKYVADKGLRDLLTRIADNYGELHDFLEPALREADERGIELTEKFFRTKYNMPN